MIWGTPHFRKPPLSISIHLYSCIPIHLSLHLSFNTSIYRSIYYANTCMQHIHINIPYLSLAQNNHINVNKLLPNLGKQNRTHTLDILRYTFTSYSMVVDTSKYLYAHRQRNSHIFCGKHVRSISCRACGRSLQAQPCLSHVEKAVAGTPCVSKNIRGHMEYACAYIYTYTISDYILYKHSNNNKSA